MRYLIFPTGDVCKEAYPDEGFENRKSLKGSDGYPEMGIFKAMQ
jgi:hypothetical protein